MRPGTDRGYMGTIGSKPLRDLLLASLLCAVGMGAALPARAIALPQMTWPHTTMVEGVTVTVSQPQAISWPDHRTLIARVAISILGPGAKVPILGTIEVTMTTETDFTTRSVILYDMQLLGSRFASLDTDQAAQIEARIRAFLPLMGARSVPLDTVLLSLKEMPPPPRGVALDNGPPVIFYSARRASLVVFNGEPAMTGVGGTDLKFAVNTNWNVFLDPAGRGTWYLLDGGEWLSAPAYSGPWTPVRALPAAFDAIPNDKSYADVRKAIPAKPARPGSTPAIFVSVTPAEIILTDGPPQFAPIPGTALQYVRNTESALFWLPATGRYYFLVSGRWFSAPGLDGPWTFATPDLPPDFARIPPSSPRGSVLASVPGTPQAQRAVREAQVPRQGTLLRSAATVEVVYAGPPQFKPIATTTMTYAVNTGYQVIGVAGKYLVCYQGAWFVGPSPTGPWVLADSVPAEIYTIPPSSPLYNVTYVTVYYATPQAITYGYTTGYTMGYVSAGVVVYGTGYYYPPYLYPAPVPVFIPYPYSYAGGTYYNSTTGAWARGGTVYGPYGAVSAGAYYNPTTGAYARGGAVYGPNGGADAWSYYNPTTGTYAHGSATWGPDGGTAHASFDNPTTGRSGSTTQNANAYGRWGSSTVSGPNQTVHTESGSNARGSAGAFSSSTGAEGAGVRGAGGNSAGVVKGAGGNVYAGADGNVYKHTDDGWSKWNDGSWSPVQPPTSPKNANTAAGKQTATAAQNPGAARPSGATTQPAAPARQGASTGQGASGSASGGAAPRGSAGGGTSQGRGEQGFRDSYGQLEQDRMARTQGFARQQSAVRGGSAGTRAFGGGRFR